MICSLYYLNFFFLQLYFMLSDSAVLLHGQVTFMHLFTACFGFIWPLPCRSRIWPKLLHNRAIAQAVSRRFPTAAVRVRAWIWSCGIRGGKSGIRGGFLLVFRFPLPILIPPTAPHSSSSSSSSSSSIVWGWYNRPTSDRRTTWTQSHPTQETKARVVALYFVHVGTSLIHFYIDAWIN
jgi:hypothetical protein